MEFLAGTADPKSLVGLVSGMRVTEIHYFSECRELHSPNPPIFSTLFRGEIGLLHLINSEGTETVRLSENLREVALNLPSCD
jgi:hypothetical protein